MNRDYSKIDDIIHLIERGTPINEIATTYKVNQHDLSRFLSILEKIGLLDAEKRRQNLVVTRKRPMFDIEDLKLQHAIHLQYEKLLKYKKKPVEARRIIAKQEGVNENLIYRALLLFFKNNERSQHD
jgi:hypothetical protein